MVSCLRSFLLILVIAFCGLSVEAEPWGYQTQRVRSYRPRTVRYSRPTYAIRRNYFRGGHDSDENDRYDNSYERW